MHPIDKKLVRQLAIAGIFSGYRCVQHGTQLPQILFESLIDFQTGNYRGSLEETRECRRTYVFDYVQRKLDRELDIRERLVIAETFRESGRFVGGKGLYQVYTREMGAPALTGMFPPPVLR